jgi:23S rRNA (adenine2030-N6)-methyltransferase
MLRVDLWIDTPRPEGKLTGSSLLLINPPYGLREALEPALPSLCERLGGGKAGWRLQ